MAKRGVGLELAFSKLYPKWIVGVTTSPIAALAGDISDEGFSYVSHYLRYSMLHRFFLNDLIVLDFPADGDRRLELRYSFMSYHTNHRVCINRRAVTTISSLDFLYSSASWLEREAYDMFGVLFNSSFYDVRRILTDYGFTHFPLRKDFPVVGYTELIFRDV